MKKTELIPIVLLCLFTTKLMILNTWSFESAIVLASLAGVVCLYQFAAKNKQIESLQKQINDHSEQFIATKKEMEQLRSHVSGLKLGASMKPQAKGF